MNKEIDDYLDKLRTSLVGLDKELVKDFVLEIETHLNESISNGQTAKRAIGQLGEPEKLTKEIKAFHRVRRIDNLIMRRIVLFVYSAFIMPLPSFFIGLAYFIGFALLIGPIYALARGDNPHFILWREFPAIYGYAGLMIIGLVVVIADTYVLKKASQLYLRSIRFISERLRS